MLNDGLSQYAYDQANRLKTVVQGTSAYTFTYNGVGDRLKQLVNSTLTTYTLDLNAGLTQVLADGSNKYVYGNSRVSQYTGASASYFLPDALGSVRQLADGTGTITLARGYEPYGDPLNRAGSGASVYGFTGEQRDGTGLEYLRARYYAPTQGRFFQHDSWKGDSLHPQSFNTYAYVSNNVVNVVDPTGQCYPPVDWLRNIEKINCENLDSAIYIYNHPSARSDHKAVAGAYIGTWYGSHLGLAVGAGIAAWEVAGWGAIYASAHATAIVATSPAAVTTVGTIATGLSLLSDGATLYAAANGDPEAIQSVMMARQMGADPLVGPIAMARSVGRTGNRFFSMLRPCEVESLSGIHISLQEAIQLAIRETGREIYLGFRPRAPGQHAERWDSYIEVGLLRAKTEFDSMQAIEKLDDGLRRLPNGDLVVSDLDIAFGAIRDGAILRQMTPAQIRDLFRRINTIYGADVITHGDQLAGLQEPIAAAFNVNRMENTFVFTAEGFKGVGPFESLLKVFGLPVPK